MPFSIYSPVSTTNPLPVDLGAVTPAQLVPGATTYAVGDLLYADTPTTLAKLAAGTSGKLLSTQGAGAAPIWVSATGGAGDMNGPASSTDNAIVRFDGTGGKTAQNSGVTIDDSNNLTVPGTGTQTFNGKLYVTNANIRLSNNYSLSGNLVSGTEVSFISRDTSDRVNIDPDGYGTVLGGIVTASSTGAHTFGTTNTVRMTAGAIAATAGLTVGGIVIHTLSATPASAAAAGTVGTLSWDSSYIYVCTATNTWKRTALSTW